MAEIDATVVRYVPRGGITTLVSISALACVTQLSGWFVDGTRQPSSARAVADLSKKTIWAAAVNLSAAPVLDDLGSLET